MCCSLKLAAMLENKSNRYCNVLHLWSLHAYELLLFKVKDGKSDEGWVSDKHQMCLSSPPISFNVYKILTFMFCIIVVIIMWVLFFFGISWIPTWVWATFCRVFYRRYLLCCISTGAFFVSCGSCVWRSWGSATDVAMQTAVWLTEARCCATGRSNNLRH